MGVDGSHVLLGICMFMPFVALSAAQLIDSLLSRGPEDSWKGFTTVGGFFLAVAVGVWIA